MRSACWNVRGMLMLNNFHLNNRSRILIIWNNFAVDVSLVDMDEQLIHLNVVSKHILQPLKISFVYCLHSIVTRRPLWDKLKQLDDGPDIPWLIMGDFNSILSPDEKKGGAHVNNYETRDLNECVAHLQLSDLPFVGCYFTWTNLNVFSKLDRAMVNSSWLQASLNAFAEFIAAGCLPDHSLNIVSVLHSPRITVRPFKFFNMWTLHEGFKNLVKDNWIFSGHGTKQFLLKRKLRNVKTPLKGLNSKNFSHISQRANRAKSELEQMQMIVLNEGEVNEDIKSFRVRTEILLEAERLFLSQKAKCEYLKNSDKCTKFFHDLIKRNNKKNAILAINTRDGSITSNHSEIANEFVTFYIDLLGTKVVGSSPDAGVVTVGQCLSMDKHEDLLAPVIMIEVQNALFAIDINKTPGPKGFGSLFFRKSWDIVRRDIFAAIQEFFQSGRPLKQWNHALTALVPKSKQATRMQDFRPISCCNVCYKIISKVLAT